MLRTLFITLLLLLFNPSALAFPTAPFDALEVDIVHLSNPLEDYDFEGIVKLSNCSGAIVRFSGQPLTSQAYVLTNGHCVKRFGFLKPGEVYHNKPMKRRMKVSNTQLQFIDIESTELTYATMTQTDSALYRLKQTYQDLQNQGISSFLLSPDHPLLGLDIEIVSGYWERGYQCHIDGFVYELRESSWSFSDSIRYSPKGCEVIGGTSGSPIVEKSTRLVVGVNNTGNQSGQRCRMNNPCEVDKEGRVTVKKGINYGQQTYWFYSCLTADFKINLNRTGCQLPK